MSGTLPPRPLLKPWYRLLHQEGKVLMQYGETLVSFEGRAAERLLPALLPLLDGARPVDEIVEIVGPAVRPAVEQALALLHEHELLTDPGPDAFAESESRSAEFLAATDPLARSGAELIEIVRAAKVAVAGSGPLAAEAAASLRRSGLRDLERLALEAPSSVLEHLQLVLVVPSGEELPALPAWNAAALAAGVPWLQVLPFDGLFAAVGPLYVPGDTGCYVCFRTRRAANVDYGAEFLALQEVRQRLPAAASLEQTVAGLAATLALRWLAHRDQFLPGTWYALELSMQPALGAHVLYRVPRCPACSGLGAAAQPLPWDRGALAA